MKWQHATMWLLMLLILGLVNLSIRQKEQLISQGQIIFLELGPRDPRSLIQGDYMALRYDIARTLDQTDLPRDGYLVLKLDKNNIAHYDSLYDPQRSLTDDEVILRYRRREGDVNLGAESFFFQEGHAEYYDSARYGELRLAPSGESILVGLRGPNLEELGPPASQ